VHFLTAIARTKVFDIPGSKRNSIDCVRMARAFDVFIFTSEEKDFNESLNADMEAKYKNK